jgi:glucoamylase
MSITQKIINKIVCNMNTTTHKGIIIASPSNDPDYNFHWIRDSALVMRVIVDYYKQTSDPVYFQYIINYVELESKIQKLHTLSGLGEPKINKNCTPYNKPWGRPQNDGPALRGIVLWSIVELFRGSYDYIIKHLLLPMIVEDLHYIISNYCKPSFDLWEEQKGWHFYTRMVQLKFIKESLQQYSFISNQFLEQNIQHAYNELLSNLQDHKNGSTIISSFDIYGNISKYDDAANILAFCHISFDEDILKSFPLQSLHYNVENLLQYFCSKYNNKSILFIGRYAEDQYYDGQAWIICSLALAQYYVQQGDKKKAQTIYSTIIDLDDTFTLPEQFNPITKEYFSAEHLTWNYSELYRLHQQLQK